VSAAIFPECSKHILVEKIYISFITGGRSNLELEIICILKPNEVFKIPFSSSPHYYHVSMASALFLWLPPFLAVVHPSHTHRHTEARRPPFV
jgi:hypothetical protein